MRIFSRLTFRTKLNIGMSSILVVMAALLLPLVGRMTVETLVEENKLRGQALSESLAARAVEPMLALDFLRLKNMVDEQIAVGDVVYVFVQDAVGHVLAHTFHKGFPLDLIRANSVENGQKIHIQLLADGASRIYDFASPVVVGTDRIGTVRIGLSKTRINATVHRQLTMVAGFFSGALLLAVILGNLFSRQVANRIGRLKEHAESMLMGDLDMQSGPSDVTHCWERQQCGLEACPAYGDTRRRCWYIAGTMCPECSDGNGRSRKQDSCRMCKVYREGAGDELQDLAETFDVMALSLKTHIGELQTVERDLRDQQRLMRTILDVTPDRVSLIDTRLRYMGANRTFAHHVGLEVPELVGKTDFDIFDEKRAEERHMAARDILDSGLRLDTQVVVEEDGVERWFHVVCIPVHGDNGRITGMLRTDRDITDLKGYERQIVQAQKMESLGLMAGGVAHEINTPLGIILGYSQLLQEDVEEGSQIYQDLCVIEKQTQVCKKIVADLLGFSRQADSTKREMCFNNSVMEAISLVRHTFQLDHVEIVTELDDRFPVIYGDPEKLKQVWINLLTNARDAMREKGGTILVRTRLDTPVGIVSLWVADTGEGISDEGIKKIFDPFYSTKPVGLGTGLGLSVSFGIIEDHDGDIHATSPVPPSFEFPQEYLGKDAGAGTLIGVNLPLDHGEEEEMEESGKNVKYKGNE